MAAPMISKVAIFRTLQFSKTYQFQQHFGKSTLNNLKGGKSSRIWMTRQLNDPFVKQAKAENLRCRSAYKLIEIDDRYQLFQQGSVVIDCGASPGSWSQVAAKRVNARIDDDSCYGKVVSIDLQSIEPIENVQLLEGCDFTEEATQTKIERILNGRQANVVLSDMAPNSTGNKHLDHDKISELCMSVLKFSTSVLTPGGHVLCKIWDGQNRELLVKVMERMFQVVYIVKPASSRSDSSEIFLLGQRYKLKKKSS